MSSSPKVLVVDDEPQIQRFLKPSLTASGYEVVAAATAADAVRVFAASAPDLVILDLGLPDGDGKTVLLEIRKSSRVPIVILSARDREAEKVEALDLGADDYLNKPFGIGELLARLRSALRRSAQQTAAPVAEFAINGIALDLPRHQVTKQGAAVHLTPKEFELLSLLMRHAGKVITHRQLLQEVWGAANVSDSQYLRVFIGQLRAKLEDDATQPALILTEPGVGYRFADPA